MINYYITQHMVQKLIAFSEGKNDPRDYYFFFIITFFSFYYLKFPENDQSNMAVTTVQPTTLLQGLGYSETVECLFLFICYTPIPCAWF